MNRHPRSRTVDRVVCCQQISGDLVFSDVTVQAVCGTGPGQPGCDPLASAQRLAGLYFSSLPRLSWGVARARAYAAEPDGRDSGWQTTLCFSLAPSAPLIILGPPRTEARPTGAAIAYPVTGGLLSRHPSTGALVFEVAFAAGRATLSVRVRDFSSCLAGECSSPWRRALYKSTQWLLHRLLVTRFLRRARRDFARAPRPVATTAATAARRWQPALSPRKRIVEQERGEIDRVEGL